MATLKTNAANKKEEKEGKTTRRTRSATTAPKTSRSKAKIGSSPEQIIEAAWEVNFLDGNQSQTFEYLYKEKWVTRKSGKDSILHYLANNGAKLPDSDIKIPQFLRWILGKYYGLLETKDAKDYTPLHSALTENNISFVNAVLNHEPRLRNLDKVLLESCQFGNSLHLAIKFKLPVDNIKQMIEICSDADKLLVSDKGKDGNTPLHTVMDLADDEDPNDGDDSESSRNNSSEDEDDGGTVDSQEQSGYLDALNAARPPDNNTLFRSNKTAQGLQRSYSWRRPEDNESAAPKQPNSTHTASALSVQKIVEMLVLKNDSVLQKQNVSKRTPYQERIHLLWKSFASSSPEAENASHIDEKSALRDAKFREVVAKDPVADFIRSYCVREFSRDNIMTCLYQPGHERHIEFDLGGMPNSLITSDYLDRLSSHLQFESILKYVALPRLTIEAPTVRKKNKGEQIPRKRGLSHLITVFKWLRKNHVERIIKVMVIDDEDPPHADSSIEEALKDFQVEIWDWKRLDLSTEVIYNSTKVVKEISLYSSGNNSVLMGWASQQGLPNDAKFPKLKDIKLFIRQGLEDRERLENYTQQFKNAIKQANNSIRVNIVPDNSIVSYASGFKNSAGDILPENPWLDSARNFAIFLRTAPQGRSVRPVRIAIIDDGVDASLEILDGKIAIGKSFCPYANSSDLMNSYFVPAGKHGTCMAALVCKICPKVELYVARLEERTMAGSDHRQITAKSAADAIRWATDCGVDIISMSWTIETPITGNDDMEDLKKAVTKAAEQDILMFGSTSDQGNSTKDNGFPAEFLNCIKIGSATDTGEPLAWVNPQKIDFLLPGKEIPLLDNESKLISAESGSSVATAAAAGLAGLLIFCSWLLKGNDNLDMRKNNMMRNAFKSMSTQPDNFPRVQEGLAYKFKQHLHRERNPGQTLTKLMQVPNIDISTLTWDDNCDKALDLSMDIITTAIH